MLGYLSAYIICSEKRTVFRERSWRKTVSFEEQIDVKGQISEHIFCAKCMLLQLYLLFSSNVFRNTRGFENWGISLGYSSVLAGEYSVT